MATKKKTAAKKPAAKAHAATKKASPAKAPAARKAARTEKAAKAGARTEELAPASTDIHAFPVVSVDNTRLGELSLAAGVFGVAPNEHLIYEAVKEYRAAARAGTHMTKNRALVSGTGKKPWRQKGTGRARVGEARNPLWRHGGTVFGPTPRDYSYRIPGKTRLAALRSALSLRLKEGALRVVDRFGIDAPKTARLREILDTLGMTGKTVVVDHEPASSLLLSGRNLRDVRVVPQTHLTVYDVMDCRHLVVSQEALAKLEARLG
jgi:large subunit ribosomal protein L4